MDSNRLEVTPVQIAEYFARLFETLSGTPGAQLVKLDWQVQQ
jgi:hypothetical protein